MANIKIINKNNQEQTFVGVKVLTVNKEGGGVANFTENPLLLDTSQNAPAQYEGMFCEDINTHASYKITRGTSGNFIVKSNFPDLFACFKIIEANGKFIALGHHQEPNNGTNYIDIFISTDGTTWERTLHKNIGSGSDNDASDQLNRTDICYGNGLIIAVANTGTYNNDVYEWYSTDGGITWTEKNYGSSSSGGIYNFSYPRLAYGNGFFLIMSKDYSGTLVRVSKTTDGITWSQYTEITSIASSSSYLLFLCYIPEDELFYIATKYDGSTKVYQSSNGSTWSDATLPVFSAFPRNSDFFKFNGYYYCTDNSNIVKAQKNDSNWTTVVSSSTAWSHCVVDTVLYIGCDSGKLIKYDGTSLTSQILTPGGQNRVQSNNGVIVVLNLKYSSLTTDYVVSESSDFFYYRPIYY